MIENSTPVWQRSRWVSLLYLAILLAFGGLFWWILAGGAPASRRFSHEYTAFIGWSGLVLCSLIGVMGILELLNPTRLIVRPEGFEQKGLWRQSMVPWSEVSGFVVWRQQSMTHVGYLLTDQARGKRAKRWHRLVAFGHYDGWLMSGMGGRPQEIADLLEGRRRAATEETGSRLSPG